MCKGPRTEQEDGIDASSGQERTSFWYQHSKLLATLRSVLLKLGGILHGHVPFQLCFSGPSASPLPPGGLGWCAPAGNSSDVEMPRLAMQSCINTVIANTVGNRRGSRQRGREMREKKREKHPGFAPTACPITEKPGGGSSFLSDVQFILKGSSPV